jgi:hypothetical protein
MRLYVAGLVLSLCAATDAVGACLGVNRLTEKSQAVQEVFRTSFSHPRRFFAEATHDRGTGRPLIIYYSRYASAPGTSRASSAIRMLPSQWAQG